jgi:hypothetical protein
MDYQRTLALKAKAHLLGLRALVHGGRALAPSPGVGVAACARAAAVAVFGAAVAKICTKIWGFSAIFGDFGSSDSYGGDSRLSAHTDRRRHPMERARAPTTRRSIPTPKTGRLFTSAGAKFENFSVARPPPS